MKLAAEIEVVPVLACGDWRAQLLRVKLLTCLRSAHTVVLVEIIKIITPYSQKSCASTMESALIDSSLDLPSINKVPCPLASDHT